MTQAYAHQRVQVTLGYSEVLCHLRLAGRTTNVDVLPEGVQLLDEDNQPISFPITHGEAGIQYLGFPEISDHYDETAHVVEVNFSGAWTCYSCRIYGAEC